MEYTGKYKTLFSKSLGMKVNVLEYRSDRRGDDRYQGYYCSLCGKALLDEMFVVESFDGDLSLMTLDAECVEKIG